MHVNAGSTADSYKAKDNRSEFTTETQKPQRGAAKEHLWKQSFESRDFALRSRRVLVVKFLI
jgi:hypothetical protein